MNFLDGGAPWGGKGWAIQVDHGIDCLLEGTPHPRELLDLGMWEALGVSMLME